MKKINLASLFLAICVIASFLAVAVAIGYRNYWLAGIFVLTGFLIMAVGLRRKRARFS